MAVSNFFGRVAYVAAMCFLAITVSSCQLAKNQMSYDRSAELDKQDYRDALAPVPMTQSQNNMADVPDFQTVVSTPEDLKLPSPLVTVSVNQTVSLRDLMMELANQAGVDVEMDPQIRGSIIFTAKDKPFDQVINRICEMSGLRYNFENNVLRVELDRPYTKNYPLDYINATRKGSSGLDTKISLSDASGGTADVSFGGSKSNVITANDGDLWKDVSEGLEQILSSSDTYISLATQADPVSTVTMPPAPVADPNNPTPPPLPGSPEAAAASMAAAPTLSVATPAAEPLIANAPATFSISKQSGMASVFANERQHKQVKKFLDEFRKRTTTQVLIEAKVLQVVLKDEFAAGIDWTEFNITGLLKVDPSFGAPGLVPDATGSLSATLFKGSDFQAAASAISRYGTVRALSSPRITVMNNQLAIVNVAQNNVYFNFDIQSEVDTDTNVRTTTIDTEQKSVPEGVLLNVLPVADPDTGEIQLSIRPTISKITSFIEDPTIGLTLGISGLDPADFPTNNIPQVSVQEMDSLLRMQSGQMMIMGGLMKDSNSVEDQGVPVLADIPYLGKAFSNHKDSIEKSELVIILRATIIPGGSNSDETDRKTYETFSLDRRPGKL